MELLSEDDLNLKDMTWDELNRARDLWFDLAQATKDFDPSWTHGVFLNCTLDPEPPPGSRDDLPLLPGHRAIADLPSRGDLYEEIFSPELSPDDRDDST
jgi:hypothetical protein